MFNGGFTDLLLLALAATLVVAAVIDVRTFTISNRLNERSRCWRPLYWLSIALNPWPGMAIQLAAGGIVFVLLAGAFYAGMMGGGDVKLAAALALWFSPAGTIKFLVLMSIAGGVLTLGFSAGIARKSARAVPKFRTESPSLLERWRFSPNAFLTILPDV